MHVNVFAGWSGLVWDKNKTSSSPWLPILTLADADRILLGVGFVKPMLLHAGNTLVGGFILFRLTLPVGLLNLNLLTMQTWKY